MTEEKVANEVHTDSVLENDTSSTFKKIQLAVRSTGLLTYSEERKLLRRVDLRLMPLLILLYLCKNLDVNNISYVTTMNKGTHHNVLTAVSYTHLTLPTICSV